jgi:hypothetical protein
VSPIAFSRSPEIISSSTLSFDRVMKNSEAIRIRCDDLAIYQATFILCMVYKRIILATTMRAVRRRSHQPIFWQECGIRILLLFMAIT